MRTLALLWDALDGSDTELRPVVIEPQVRLCIKLSRREATVSLFALALKQLIIDPRIGS